MYKVYRGFIPFMKRIKYMHRTSLPWEHVAKWIEHWTQDQKVWVGFSALFIYRSVGQVLCPALSQSTQPVMGTGSTDPRLDQ